MTYLETAEIVDSLYHSTPIEAAEEILKQKRFKFRPTISTQSDNVGNETAKFFMSFSREKFNDFSIRAGDWHVTFCFDRKLLKTRYKFKPIDYWGQRSKRNYYGIGNSESEERLLSSKPYLDFSKMPKLITGIHIFTSDMDISGRQERYQKIILGRTINIIKHAKILKIPVFLYDDKKAYHSQNKTKAISINKLVENYKKVVTKLFPEIELHHGNPGGDWLKYEQQRVIDKANQRTDLIGKRFLFGSTTLQANNVVLPIKFLESINIKGALNEERHRGDPKYDALDKLIKEKGWEPEKHPIMIWVNHLGEPYIYEGNTRYSYAKNNYKDYIVAEIQWKNGGELIEGPFNPDNIKNIVKIEQRKNSSPYRSSSTRDNYTGERIKAYIQLLSINDVKKLSKRARKILFDLDKGYFMDDMINSLQADLHNENKNPNSVYRPMIENLTKLMGKNKLNGLGALHKMLAKKWSPLLEKHRNDMKKRYNERKNLMKKSEVKAYNVMDNNHTAKWITDKIRAPYMLVFQIRTLNSSIKPIPGWQLSQRFQKVNQYYRFYVYKFLGVLDARALDLQVRLAIRRLARINGFRITDGYDRLNIISPEILSSKKYIIKPFAIDWDTGKALKRRNYITTTFGDFKASKELLQFWGITRRSKFSKTLPSSFVNYKGKKTTLDTALEPKSFGSYYRLQVRRVLSLLQAKFVSIKKAYKSENEATSAIERFTNIIQQEAAINSLKNVIEKVFFEDKTFRRKLLSRNVGDMNRFIFKSLINRLSLVPEIKAAIFKRRIKKK